jgi:hypothetical protein
MSYEIHENMGVQEVMPAVRIQYVQSKVHMRDKMTHIHVNLPTRIHYQLSKVVSKVRQEVIYRLEIQYTSTYSQSRH